MTDGLMLVGGVVLLYFGAEWLVGGASGLALAMRVPQLIVGLTVVAYGTSAPEVIVGVQAAHDGHGDIALGNVVGSNIANLGLILAISVLVRPAKVDGALRRRELPALVVGACAMPALLWDGVVSRWEAGLLLFTAVAYTAWMVRSTRSSAELSDAIASAEGTQAAAQEAGAPQGRSRARLASTAAAGLAVLLLGGHLFVTGAASVAHRIGMSDRIVGLTIVAIGTSLPELATGVIAAARGQSDIAVGNVVGSNIFNVFLCLGAAGFAGDVGAPLAKVGLDLGVLGAMTLVAVVTMRTARTMARWEGAILLAGYAAFLVFLATRPA